MGSPNLFRLESTNMKDNGDKELCMVKEHFMKIMVTFTLVTSPTTKNKDLEDNNSIMEINMRANTKIIYFMAKVFIDLSRFL